MTTETGICDKWVLVYNGNVCYVAQKNEDQTTVSKYTIETFDTEQEMTDRADELGLTLPVGPEDE